MRIQPAVPAVLEPRGATAGIFFSILSLALSPAASAPARFPGLLTAGSAHEGLGGVARGVLELGTQPGALVTPVPPFLLKCAALSLVVWAFSPGSCRKAGLMCVLAAASLGRGALLSSSLTFEFSSRLTSLQAPGSWQ